MTPQEDAAFVAPAADKGGRKKRGWGWLVWLLLLGIAALVWVGWHDWQQQAVQQRNLEHAIAQLRSVQQEELNTQQATDAALNAKLASLQDQVLLHGQKLATLGQGGATLWLLHEAKSLASLAQQRLLLTADLPATYKLLLASDQVLSRIDDPKVLPARRALAQDMEKVNAAQQIDTTSLLLQLGAMIGQLQSLTLPQAVDSSDLGSEDEAASTWWQRLLSRLPISIRRFDKSLPLPLAPAQLAQARLALNMSLQQAQLALLQGRAPVYDQSLAQADDILGSYFSGEDTVVSDLRQQVANLRRARINQALPQIGAGLEAINAVLQPLDKAGQGG